jgi:transcriptional regulator with XRE-family HTH domain
MERQQRARRVCNRQLPWVTVSTLVVPRSSVNPGWPADAGRAIAFGVRRSVTARPLSEPLDTDVAGLDRQPAREPGKATMGDHLEDDHDRGYTARLGARLRSLRRQLHLSLQEVEAASDHKFKASVLGAYERGERAISAPRLQRLARVYRVPVDQMVPSDEPGMAPTGDEKAVDLTAGPGHTHRDDRPVTIDLAALAQLEDHESKMLARYLRTIEVQRGDYNGRILTIRRHDLTAIACIFGCHPDQVPSQLDNLGLRLVP